MKRILLKLFILTLPWRLSFSIKADSSKRWSVRKLLFYNLSQQKRTFVDVRLKSLMVQIFNGPLQVNDVRLFCDFCFSSKRHSNSYWVAQKVFGYCNFLGQKRSFT